MKKLNKTDAKRFEELKEELRKKLTALQEATEAYNTAQQEAWNKYTEVREEFDACLDECQSLVNAIGARMERYYEEKSDSWLNSEAGQAFEAFKDTWTEVDLDAEEPEEPVELPEAPEDVVTAFEGLPEEVEGV